MAIAFVNSAKATSGATSALSQAVTYSPTPGNFVVVMLSPSVVGITGVTCQDSNGNLLTAGPTMTRGFLFYGTAISGATSYTFNWSGSSKSSLIIGEYSGVGRTGTSGVQNGNSVTPQNTLTTTGSNAWIVAVLNTGANSSYTAASGNLRNQQGGGVGNSNSIALVDNSAATSGTSVTNSATISAIAWASAGLELLPLPFPPMIGTHRSGTTEAHRLANL